MSENIDKVTDANATRTVVTSGEEPVLDGTTQSIGDTATPAEPVDQEALDEQTLASDGVVMEEPAGEDASEYVAEPIANEVQEDQSFWNGFFGKP
jgi:hypothetical protein